jgi:lysophospholipase L1-like esterase
MTSRERQPDAGESSASVPIPERPAAGGMTFNYTGHGPRVLVLGDSLTLAGWSLLYELLTPRYGVLIAAWKGEGYNRGKMSDRFDVSLLPRAAAFLATTNPQVAVIAAGTNDAWFGRSLAGALDAMYETVEVLRGACLIGVTLRENVVDPSYSNEVARALNAAMYMWADEVVDFARIADRPGMLQGDGIHTTPAGTVARARAITAAVERCHCREGT